ncbi:hypothetical protein CWI37_0215p0010 [Hamiltosporidium tvaerminnensis]|uniref:Uncharacterized protein n=1 Tax=Hamiltosporidium tvaerminnensis TaxID=1176355 RepID=A0A4Q9L8H4_9MICR|nr:hypothetical protein CWI37_0215p0010 [Hamiltosporidium tvaerminnensis]
MSNFFFLNSKSIGGVDLNIECYPSLLMETFAFLNFRYELRININEKLDSKEETTLVKKAEKM